MKSIVQSAKLPRCVLELATSLILALINMVGLWAAAVEKVGTALRKVCFQAQKWVSGWGGHLWNCLSSWHQNLQTGDLALLSWSELPFQYPSLSYLVWAISFQQKILLTFLSQQEDIYRNLPQIRKLLTIWASRKCQKLVKNWKHWMLEDVLDLQTLFLWQNLLFTRDSSSSHSPSLPVEGRSFLTWDHSNCYRDGTALQGAWRTAAPSASLFIALFSAIAFSCQAWGRMNSSWDSD